MIATPIFVFPLKGETSIYPLLSSTYIVPFFIISFIDKTSLTLFCIPGYISIHI